MISFETDNKILNLHKFTRLLRFNNKKIKSVDCVLTILDLKKLYKMKLLFKIFIVGILFSSCSGVNKQAKVIPADADFVGIVDLPKIGIKSKMHANKSFAMFDVLSESLDNETFSILANGILRDRNESGINTTSPLYFYLMSEQSYGAVVVSLSSNTKFADYLELHLSDEFTKEEKKDVVLYTDERNEVIAFNSKTACFIQLQGVYSTDFIANLFSLETEKSIVSHDACMSFLNKSHDVAMFVQSEKLLNFSGTSIEKEIAQGLNMRGGDITLEELRDSYLSLALSFNKKSITLTTELLANESLAKKLREQNISKTSISKDILKYVPESTLIFSHATFDTQKLRTVIEAIDYNNTIQNIALLNGTSIEALLSEFAGDVIFSLHDVVSEGGKYTTTMFSGVDSNGYPIFTDTVLYKQKMTPKMSFVFKLVQKEKLQKLFDQFSATVFTKTDTYYKLPEQLIYGYDVYLAFEKNMLIITTDKDVLTQASEGGYKKSIASNPIAKNITPSGYMYVNLDYETYPDEIQYSVEKMGMQDFIPTFSIINSLEIFSKKEFSGTIQLNLKQGGDNSLYQVLTAIDNFSGL